MARLARVEVFAADEIAERLRRVFSFQFSVFSFQRIAVGQPLAPFALGRMW